MSDDQNARYAILGKDNLPIQCKRRRAFSWLVHGGFRRCLFEREQIGQVLIETGFETESREADGPPLFWVVRMSSPARPSIGINPALFPMSAFLEVLDKKMNTSEGDGLEAEMIEAVCQIPPPFQFQRRFGTLDSAYAFYKLALKRLRALERSSQVKPEKEQVLLAELGQWCERKWGRQAEVARRVGVSPQTVNDWLSGRKKMTGIQALNVLELVEKERKRQKLAN